MIFFMPFLTNGYRKGRVSSGLYYKAETIILYALWLVFFVTYLQRVQGRVPIVEGEYKEHVALLGWISIMLGYKLSGLLNRKRNQL